MNFIFFAELSLHGKSHFHFLAYPWQMHPAGWLLCAQGTSEQVNWVGNRWAAAGPGGLDRSASKEQAEWETGEKSQGLGAIVWPLLTVRLTSAAPHLPCSLWSCHAGHLSELPKCQAQSLLWTFAWAALCPLTFPPALSLFAWSLHRSLPINITSPKWQPFKWTSPFKIAPHPTHHFLPFYSSLCMSCSTSHIPTWHFIICLRACLVSVCITRI